MSQQVMIGDMPVKRIGLGTNKITDTAEARSLLDYAVKTGINFIDTAHLYTGGASETTIGDTLSPYPDGLAVTTKGGFSNHSNYNDPEFLRANLDDSLRRLKTSQIILYQLHRIDPAASLKRTMETFKTFQDEGKIKYIGLSEASVSQIKEAQNYAHIVSVQNEYSLTERKHDDVLDYCTEQGIIFIPWFPLRHINDQQRIVLENIAREHDATAEQIALAWLLRRSPMMLPIPGTLSKQHLKENLDSLNISLTGEEYHRLTGLA